MLPTNLQPDQAQTPLNDSADTPTVLIIEHDVSTRDLYQRALSRDFKVLVCDDEIEALKLMQAHPLKAIILEPAMYGGRGWTLLSTIKETPVSQHVPVILCSTLDERKRGLAMGAAMCMVKPVLPSVLIDTVHKVAAPV
jgi:DNA-binding response OmpR family regulator